MALARVKNISKKDPGAAILERAMGKYWDRRSSSYSGQNMAQLGGPKRGLWERALFSDVAEDRPLKVLDIGTGPGFFAILAALRGHEVTAADMSPAMLEKARLNAETCGVDVDFVEVGHDLPFEEESFDLIISRDVTWTLTEPERQLSRWADMLRPGGVMRYFDAEWYFHLRSPETRELRKRDIEDIEAKGGFVYSEADRLEAMAENLPMTYLKRPEWDRVFWSEREDMSFNVETELNSVLYTEKEQLQYRLYPEFLITVRRDL
jgi:SAM-dependent methyltransferase